MDNRICGRCHKNVVRTCEYCSSCNTAYHPSCFKLKSCCTGSNSLKSSDRLENRVCKGCNKNVDPTCKYCSNCKTLLDNSYSSNSRLTEEKSTTESVNEKVKIEHQAIAAAKKSTYSRPTEEKSTTESANEKMKIEHQAIAAAKKSTYSRPTEEKSTTESVNEKMKIEHQAIAAAKKSTYNRPTEEKSTPESVNEKVKIEQQAVPAAKESTFKLGFLNARSMIRKFDRIKRTIEENNFSLFGIIETWLNENHLDERFEIKGYNFIRCDRRKRGGGLILYIRNDIEYDRIRISSTIDTSQVEQLWCEIRLENTPVAFGLVYRPPQVYYKKLNYVIDALSEISLKYDIITLFGDFNINYLFEKSTRKRSILTNWEEKFDMVQLVKEPTRFNKTGGTLLDHVYCNRQTLWKVENTKNHLSDHNMIVCTLEDYNQLDKKKQLP